MRILKRILFLFLLIDLVLILLYFFPQFIILPTAKIKIRSESSKIKVSLSDYEFIERKLNEIHFWKEKNIFIYLDNSSLIRGPQTARRIEFIVTDKPQTFQQFSYMGKGNRPIIYQSYNIQYDKSGLVQIKLNIPTNKLKLDSSDQLSIDFGLLILHSVYNSTHPVLPNMKDTSERYSLLKNYLQEAEVKRFITIKRK